MKHQPRKRPPKSRFRRHLYPTSGRRAPSPAEPAVRLWGPAAGEPVADPPRPAQVAHLDQYFADLDAAFATLDTAPAGPGEDRLGSFAGRDIDWFHMTLDAPPAALPDLPLSIGEPVRQPEPAPQADPALPARRPIVNRARSRGRAARHRRRTETGAGSPQPPAPDVRLSRSHCRRSADAFAAILAAEQHEPMPALADLWPTFANAASAAAGVRQRRPCAQRSRHRRNHAPGPRSPVRSDRPRNGRGPRVARSPSASSAKKSSASRPRSNSWRIGDWRIGDLVIEFTNHQLANSPICCYASPDVVSRSDP